MDGRGKRVYSNGNSYAGRFKNGLPHGGEDENLRRAKPRRAPFLMSGSRLRYRGLHEIFKRGRVRRPVGTRTFPRARLPLEGAWREIRRRLLQRGVSREGQPVVALPLDRAPRHAMSQAIGKYTFSDGGYYEGQYCATTTLPDCNVVFPKPNGKRHGFGVRVWVSGSRYEGAWRDDYMSGKGTIFKGNSAKFEGTYASAPARCRQVLAHQIHGRPAEGSFFKNAKWGVGRETWGNSAGTPFRCPLGYKHPGHGMKHAASQSIYAADDTPGICQDIATSSAATRTGSSTDTASSHAAMVGSTSVNGSTVACTDVRLAGRRNGAGRMEYIPDAEKGDPERLHLGGVDAMYRTLRYVGRWIDDERTGLGQVPKLEKKSYDAAAPTPACFYPS
eukprot:scaffold2022_cov261-Pinguiococcus_pyrenoidosus.AAC.6